MILLSADGWDDDFPKCVEALVHARANVNTVGDETKMTPLMIAIKYCREMEIVRLLVERGTNVNAADYEGTTALMFARSAELVEYLVGRGANVDAVDSRRRTPLMFAEDTAIVECLVAHGASVNAVDEFDETPLMYAAANCALAAVELLVGRGALVNTTSEDGMTAVARAAGEGHRDVVQFLVKSGADLATGWSPVAAAAEYNRRGVVEYLVEDCKADMNKAGGYFKLPPLLHAATKAFLELARYLVERGADVNCANGRGETALMRTAENGRLDVARFLLDRGADVNLRTPDGRTAFSVAAHKGHETIQRLLLRRLQRHYHRIPDSKEAAKAVDASEPSSWFIAPAEIELQGLVDTKHVGAEYRGKWLGADIVVKLYIPGATNNMFEREVAIWLRLRYPNVIKLYGACNIDHRLFVYEYATNGSLVEYLAATERAGGRRTPWKYLHQATLGLAYLHERKIVHGDLRSSNIVVGSDGVVKLAGFGLSAPSKEEPYYLDKSLVFGSRRWKSPDQLDGKGDSTGSDVFSLGLCIVEAVTGEAPWEGEFARVLADIKKGWDWNRPLSMRDYGRYASVDKDLFSVVTQICMRACIDCPSASAVVQILERLSAKEAAAAAADQTSETVEDAQMGVDAYDAGEIVRLWREVEAYMRNQRVGGLKEKLFRELEAIYRRLRQSRWTWRVLKRFSDLLDDFRGAVVDGSHQNRILQLSLARAAGANLHAIWRQTDAMWAMVDNSRVNDTYRFQKWQEKMSSRLEWYVSEVSNTLLVVNELPSEKDRRQFFALVKAEIDHHAQEYPEQQLAVMKKTYDDFVKRTSKGALAAAPEWYLPWFELVYNKHDSIGSGGFGSVVRAKWLDSEVAVKVLDTLGPVKARDDSIDSLGVEQWSQIHVKLGKETDEETKKAREMFMREADIWFGLSHPHVVRLFGACHVGTPFFACEYATNGSLDKYLRKHPDQLWQKLYEAALGVCYLHERAIIHGDLKCNNIVVGGDGKAKATDFGLSSTRESEAPISGAWHWVAPECLGKDASQPTPALDVYSLAMCIVEALRIVEDAARPTGQPVVPTAPWGRLADEHGKQGNKLPPRPETCTDYQWRLVEKMCAYPPENRITIGMVVDELLKLAQGDDHDEAERSSARTDPANDLRVILNGIVEMREWSLGDANAQIQQTVRNIYGPHWDRLADLSAQLTADLAQLGALRALVESARASTKELQDRTDTLLEYTDTSFRGYALHSRLDKFMDAQGWRTSHGSNVHDRKSRWPRRAAR